MQAGLVEECVNINRRNGDWGTASFDNAGNFQREKKLWVVGFIST